MTMTSKELMKAMDDARFDPAGKALSVLDAVDDNLAGNYRLVDPTNPFMLLWEMAGAAGAHVLNAIDVMHRKRFPSLALTAEDIYLHMTDRDFLNIFSKPPTAPFTILVSRDEVLRYAVEVTPGGMKKLVMPKNSTFTAGVTTFTMEYPIEFRIPPVGDPYVVYGSPENGVLHEANGNLLETIPSSDTDGTPMLMIKATVSQMTIASEVYQLNQAVVWNTRIAYKDLYHYCRAYTRIRRDDGTLGWKPIQVTYQGQVFDPYTPTILIKVYNGVIEAKLPIVYQTTGLISGEIRLDIYTTKAENDVKWNSYAPNEWVEEWIDLDNEDNGKYTANWGKVSTYSIYSDGYTSDGAKALTLEELRDRVMQHNTGPINLPITQVNLAQVLLDSDYNTVKDIDAITKRTLNATRELAGPLDKYTVTPITAAVENIIVSLTDLNGVPGVSHNGTSVTLHPTVLFKHVDGAVTFVRQNEIDALRQLKPEAMARQVSSAGYRFTPFHWVLDASNESFAVRCYYLDAPEILSRRYWLENPTLQLDLQTAKTIVVSRDEKGYLIHLLTQSGKIYQDLDDTQVQVQLAYTPPGESTMAYLNGTLITKSDGNRVYEFLLETTYAIDSADTLTLKNFSMFGDGPLPHQIDLTIEFDIIYTVSDYKVLDMKESAIDTAKNRQMLPYDAIGILQERVRVKLGDPLKYLWAGSRTLSTEEDYEVYDYNVPAFYKENELATNADGSLKVEIIDGKLVTEIIAKAGDPVLNEDGSPKYEKFAGEFVRDVNGNKVLKSGRQLARQIDLTLFDGRYYFANDQSTIDYMTMICTKLLQWAGTDMANTNKRVLEKTTLFLKPLATTGMLKCIVEGGATVTLNAEQSFKVTVYMNENDWKNAELQDKLRVSIISQLAEGLTLPTTVMQDIANKAKDNSGGSALAIRITGLGGDKNYPLVTMADDSGRLSIAKKLTALPDGTFTVEEDVDFSFVKHLPARGSD